MYIFPKIDYYYYDDIIIFILLIAGVCVGLPALIWALRIIYNHRKNGGQISALFLLLLLLLNDLLELLLSLFIVSYLYSDNNKIFTLHIKQISWPEYVHRYNIVYGVVNALWATLRIGGLYLHQMVALQSIFTLKNPTCTAHIFSPSCSIMCIILWLFQFVCQFLYFHLILNTVFCLSPFCIVIVTCRRFCKVSPSHGHVPHVSMKPGSAVLIVFTLTLFAVCAPSITVLISVFQRKPYMNIHDTVSAFLVSVRVVSDPLLCVLVCKEKLRAQTQTRTQLNTDHQSV